MEGRLINYLVDCITSGRERDQAYAAILLARLLTHVRFSTHLAVLQTINKSTPVSSWRNLLHNSLASTNTEPISIWFKAARWLCSLLSRCARASDPMRDGTSLRGWGKRQYRRDIALTQAAHASTMARELLGNGQAITGLLGMLTSWEEPVRLAAVRALAKVCWQVRPQQEAHPGYVAMLGKRLRNVSEPPSS